MIGLNAITSCAYRVDRVKKGGEGESFGVMATRPTSLDLFAATTGDTLVSWQHFGRMMTKAPGRYNTSLGRGHRDVPVNVAWLASTFLAGVIGDPKNAAVEVPRYGDLRLSSSWEEARQAIQEGNALNFLAPNHTTVNRFPLYTPVLPSDGGKIGVFFDDIISDINYVAHRWSSEHHSSIDQGYEAEISLGIHPWVKVSVPHKRDKSDTGVQWWLQRVYTAPLTSSNDVTSRTRHSPIQRRAVITGKHITMLARLWADTLKRLDVLAPGSEPLPVDGGQDQTKQSASLRKLKTNSGKKTKAAEAPPPTAFDNPGPPASSRAFQQLHKSDYTLSLSPRARAGMLDATESLQEGCPSTTTSEHFRYVEAERIAC